MSKGPPELVESVSRSRAHWKWTTLAAVEVSSGLGVGDQETLVEVSRAVVGMPPLLTVIEVL